MNDLLEHIGSGIAIAKGLLEISKEYNNATFIKQISDLTLQLAQVQNEAAKMMTELQTLRAEADEREKNPIHYTGAVYRDTKNRPYCPACYDDKRKQIHLIDDGDGCFRCPICQNHFDESD
jgi:transposase-like protein